MNKLLKRSVLFLMVALVAVVPALTYGQEGIANKAEQQPVAQTAAEIEAYWTPERMAEAAANPMPLPTIDASLGQPSTDASLNQSVGVPGLVNGTFPKQKYDSEVVYNQTSAEGASSQGSEPQYGGPPGNWSTSYPGPFQRWTWMSRYLTFPVSTIGKLFFTQNGSNYVCSASVVYADNSEHDVVATAGHCVSDGAGNWSTNMYFCPSYISSGPNPQRGCWTSDNLITFTAWHGSGDIEADVACMIAHDTGTIINDHVGNVTGTLGRAWNWGADEPEFSFGYPAASPFPGWAMVAVVGPEWYTYDWGSHADSKYMGNDMTGGSSGGPWILGWGHPTIEFSDTDGTSATDPLPGGTGWLNGVNSHKIVVGGVTRSQEMGSAQFTNSDPDTEVLWSSCGSSADSY